MSLHRKVAVALSGGVDSSVAMSLLLKNPQVKQVVALHMSNWDARDEDDAPSRCYQQDVNDVEAVCRHLSDTPLHKVSFAAEYWTHVFEPLIDGLMQGKTPNPDVGCNTIVKFGAMKAYAHRHLDADWIATGHYARLFNWKYDVNDSMSDKSAQAVVEQSLEKHAWLYKWNESPLLLASADKTKDQSYFLAGVRGENFHNVIFPLGELYKTESATGGTFRQKTVRQIALDENLPNASKSESMGICFVGKRRFNSFISQYLPSVPPPGNFVDVETGEIVGQHNGSIFYTIGQGAKISGASQKWFVVGRRNVDTSTVLVCQGTHHPALYTDELLLEKNAFCWIGGSIPDPLSNRRLHVSCRTRHLQPLLDCEIEIQDSFIVVRLHKPLRAITPGQMAVFYIGDVCLGGGMIYNIGKSYYDRGMDLPKLIHPSGHNDVSVKI